MRWGRRLSIFRRNKTATLLAVVVLAAVIEYNVLSLMRLDTVFLYSDGHAIALTADSVMVQVTESLSSGSRCQWQLPPRGEYRFIPTPGKSSSFTIDLTEPQPLSAITSAGPAGTVHTAAAEGRPWTFTAGFNASEGPASVFFAPQPARLIKFTFDGSQAEPFALTRLALNCPGCSWIPSSEVSPSMPALNDGDTDTFVELRAPHDLTFDLRHARVVAGVSLRLAKELHGSASDPATVVLFSSPNGGDAEMAEFARFEVSDRSMLRADVPQVVYFEPRMARTVKMVVESAAGGENGIFRLAGVEFGSTCTGGTPAGVDAVRVVHYAPSVLRKRRLEAQAREMGMQVGFSDSWMWERVLKEKDSLEWLWPGMAKLEMGGEALEWVGRRAYEAWRELQQGIMQTRMTPVHKGFLRRIAVTAQHFEIYAEFHRLNVTVGLVLEDDCAFVPYFTSLFSKMISEAPPPEEYDIIFVGGCLNKHAKDLGGVRMSPWLWKIPQHRCASGYVVTRRFIEKMLSGNWTRIDPFLNIDGFLEVHMGSTLPDVYWSEPPIVFERSKVCGFFVGPESESEKNY
ncbi:putative glycosyltransferase family 25 [Diplonema papillatum]|nr:putative glycosyltransferase family 25 [Diplonema papillatum]KAJ9463449.1 putative glycosyltransferase family 25 [Diplonema papillatum]